MEKYKRIMKKKEKDMEKEKWKGGGKSLGQKNWKSIIAMSRQSTGQELMMQ